MWDIRLSYIISLKTTTILKVILDLLYRYGITLWYLWLSKKIPDREKKFSRASPWASYFSQPLGLPFVATESGSRPFDVLCYQRAWEMEVSVRESGCGSSAWFFPSLRFTPTWSSLRSRSCVDYWFLSFYRFGFYSQSCLRPSRSGVLGKRGVVHVFHLFHIGSFWFIS